VFNKEAVRTFSQSQTLVMYLINTITNIHPSSFNQLKKQFH